MKECSHVAWILPDSWVQVGLFSDVEFLDQRLIARFVRAADVIKKFAAFADHGDQAATGRMILGGLLQVIRQKVDAGGQDCNLDIGGACVLITASVFRDDTRFVVNSHIERKRVPSGTRAVN